MSVMLTMPSERKGPARMAQILSRESDGCTVKSMTNNPSRQLLLIAGRCVIKHHARPRKRLVPEIPRASPFGRLQKCRYLASTPTSMQLSTLPVLRSRRCLLRGSARYRASQGNACDCSRAWQLSCSSRMTSSVRQRSILTGREPTRRVPRASGLLVLIQTLCDIFLKRVSRTPTSILASCVACHSSGKSAAARIAILASIAEPALWNPCFLPTVQLKHAPQAVVPPHVKCGCCR